MSDPSWLTELRAIRHQAVALANLALACEQLRELERRLDERQLEARYHVRAMSSWIERRRAEDDAEQSWCGACQTVLIDRDSSGRGFLARVVIDDSAADAAPFPHDLDESCRGSLRAARSAALRQLAAWGGIGIDRPLVCGERFGFAGPPALAGLEKRGRSASAAGAVALVSRWCDLELAGDLVVCAEISSSGTLVGVQQLPEKIATALRERPRATVLVARDADRPRGDPRVIGVGDIEQLLRAVFGDEPLRRAASGRVDIEGCVRRGVELYEKHNDFAAADAVLRAALAAIEQRRTRGSPLDLRVEEHAALWRLGAASIHRGEISEAEAVFSRAEQLGEQLWDEQLISPEQYLGFHGNRAVLLRDSFRYDEAERCLRRALALQHELRIDRRQQAKTLGNLGELLAFSGRYDEAQVALDEAYDHLASAYPEELPRALCNLGNLALHRGDLGRAVRCYERGLELNRCVQHGRQLNEAFLCYGLARAELGRRRAVAAGEAARRGLSCTASDSVYPRRLLVACDGLATLVADRWPDARALLVEAAELTGVSGHLLRFGVATILGHLAIAELQARDRIEAGDLAATVELLARSARAVVGLPGAEQLCARIERLAGRPWLERAELSEALEALVRAFPYGIDPALWCGPPHRSGGRSARAVDER